MTILVTGGAGFIGAHFVRDWLVQRDEAVVNLDKLTYAGDLRALADVRNDARHIFVQGDIGNGDLVSDLLFKHDVRAVVHFAAETHVDRSLSGPADFIETNIVGGFSLLRACAAHHARRADFRFLQVSTDEVYGTLEEGDAAFAETHSFLPNSPYAASKAGADHLARAWHHSFGLPVLITHCSNNYGPYQHAEKLIPRMIACALAGHALPVYGDGKNIRDWLYVGDHCAALRRVLDDGRPGQHYNIGGNCEKRNIDLVKQICAILDREAPRKDGASYVSQIAFVTDRAGHDRRYAIDAAKIARELDWQPQTNFDDGLLRTVQWYLAHRDWLDGDAG